MTAFAPCAAPGTRAAFPARTLCARRSQHARPMRPMRRRLPRACADAQSAEDLLTSSDYVERIRGINRAAEIGVPARLALLLPLARSDAKSQVRFCALSHLASLPLPELDAAARTAVLDCARVVLRDDSESSCRSGAADVIAGLRLVDGFGDLVAAYEATTDWMLRFSIVAGMGELAHEDAFEFLERVVTDEKNKGELVLAAAIGALGDLGDPRGVRIIERFVESEDMAVRERANIAKTMLEKAPQ